MQYSRHAGTVLLFFLSCAALASCLDINRRALANEYVENRLSQANITSLREDLLTRHRQAFNFGLRINEAIEAYGDRRRRQGRSRRSQSHGAMEESVSDMTTYSYEFQIEKGQWDSTAESVTALALDVAAAVGLPLRLTDVPIIGVFFSAAESEPDNFESYMVSLAAGFVMQTGFIGQIVGVASVVSSALGLFSNLAGSSGGWLTHNDVSQQAAENGAGGVGFALGEPTVLLGAATFAVVVASGPIGWVAAAACFIFCRRRALNHELVFEDGSREARWIKSELLRKQMNTERRSTGVDWMGRLQNDMETVAYSLDVSAGTMITVNIKWAVNESDPAQASVGKGLQRRLRRTHLVDASNFRSDIWGEVSNQTITSERFVDTLCNLGTSMCPNGMFPQDDSGRAKKCLEYQQAAVGLINDDTEIPFWVLEALCEVGKDFCPVLISRIAEEKNERFLIEDYTYMCLNNEDAGQEYCVQETFTPAAWLESYHERTDAWMVATDLRQACSPTFCDTAAIRFHGHEEWASSVQDRGWCNQVELVEDLEQTMQCLELWINTDSYNLQNDMHEECIQDHCDWGYYESEWGEWCSFEGRTGKPVVPEQPACPSHRQSLGEWYFGDQRWEDGLTDFRSQPEPERYDYYDYYSELADLGELYHSDGTVDHPDADYVRYMSSSQGNTWVNYVSIDGKFTHIDVRRKCQDIVEDFQELMGCCATLEAEAKLLAFFQHWRNNYDIGQYYDKAEKGYDGMNIRQAIEWRQGVWAECGKPAVDPACQPAQDDEDDEDKEAKTAASQAARDEEEDADEKEPTVDTAASQRSSVAWGLVAVALSIAATGL